MLARIATMIALGALFTGCASYDNGYRDGAYYHPSRGSEGDYYYGRPPVNRGYYNPYYGPYGAPFYYSPYPYYRPYRYRPYYGPFRSSYYRSGFGAAYTYGGFSGYRDPGHSSFGFAFAYADHDRDRHHRGRYERRGRHDNDGQDHSGHDRLDPVNGRSDRRAAPPIIDGADRRDAQWARPGFGDDRRAFDRRSAPPAPRFRAAPEPATVRLQPEGGRLVQMRRVDSEPGKSRKRFSPKPAPQPTRAAPLSTTAAPLPAYRGSQAERRLPARESNANATISPPSPALLRAHSPQRGLNDRARQGGKETRNASQLSERVDTVDE